MKTFKTILKKHMKDKKLSAKWAALEFGVSRRCIFLWRSGTNEPPAKRKAELIEWMSYKD